MDASIESNSKQTMESVASVVVRSQPEEVILPDQQQWSNGGGGGGGVVYWQESGEEGQSRGSVAEAVPVASNDIGALHAPHGNDGTFLCLDCDMPLNIEMKKDHLLVCKSRHPDADKVDHHQMVTSTPLSRPTLLTCVSNQSPITGLSKDICNNTPIARTTTLLQTANNENTRSVLENQSAILVSEGNTVTRVGLIANVEGNTVVRGGGGLLTTEANQVARGGLITEHTVISRADLMGEQTVISRSGLEQHQPVISMGGTMSQSTLITSVSDENQLPRDAIITSMADSGDLSRSTLITTSVADDARPTLIATMTEDGIMVTTSPNGSIQLMEPVLAHQHNITETYVTSTTSQPMVKKLKPLPTVQVICQPNGKQCKVYTDDVENYKCQVCKYTTTTAEKLSMHKCVSLADKLKCTECSYVGESMVSLSRHMVTHRKTRNCMSVPLKCPPELDQFVEKRRLNTTNEEVFACKLCNFTSALFLSIKHHTQMHSVENKLRCDKCDFSCKLEVNLRNHKLTHEPKGGEVKQRKRRSGGLSIFCKICDHEYVKGEDPNNHIDTHLKMDSVNLTYQCKVCAINCETLQSSRDHVRVHMKSWPYQCEKCPFMCNKVLEMKVHIKTVHDVTVHQRKELACDECNFKCKLGSNLKLHQKTVHPKRSPRTPVMERNYMTTRRRAKMAKLPAKCTKCEFTSATRAELEAHMKKMHKNTTTYECAECEYTCKLLRNFEHHMLIHENDKDSS
ncbi:hypothetical protein LSTR_LSTR009975 [Laodelphax striatellus]|uniref:C2H2-type domain-containing protein n=1 Tax=Laodelphax striatellus TaxID=195883 RepID=A0A482WHQ7_LAOST|nr:hypothetical protein LSTR_LSTR009975 [Laodelphax striatellus]